MARRRKASEAPEVAEDEAGEAVSEELGQIETGSIDKLVAIKQAQEKLQGLIEKAETSRDKVSAEVFERVVRDYDTRIEAHEKEAVPLREEARSEFGKLRIAHARFQDELARARLDAEELRFRHELGELPESDFEEKQKESAGIVSRCEKAFEAADALRQRFLEVIPEPDEEPAAASPPPPPPPPAAEAAADEAPVDEDLEATVYDVSAPRFDPDNDTTQDSAAPVASLVEQRADDAEPATYPLGRTTTIGRTPDNDIALDFPEVSRHHAKIVATPEGFMISDLKSGNGTYVNDQRLDEGPIKDGDVVRFGSLAFLVQAGE